ncbi:MAG: PH domain-containing protein [Sulfolobus sp.]|nr:PH domain-containing protein [Sulfolobus sp.]
MIKKTVVKGTIVLLIFSSVLEISPQKIINYLIFVGVWYLTLLAYILWKRSYIYCIDSDNIHIKGILTERYIRYSDISEAFVSQGFLAKRFKCGSVYLITPRRVEIIKDIQDPEKVYQEIEKFKKNDKI